MQTGAFKRATGLVLLYIGLFILLVLLQFSKGPGLSEKIGGMSVSVSYSKSERGKSGAAPERVRILYAGLSFEISPKSAAESIGADGVASTLVLSAIEKIPNGVRVKLTPGVELKATADKGTMERFSIAAAAPDGIVSVRLRLLPSSSVSFLEKDGRRSVSSNGDSFDLILASGSLDGNAGILALRPGDAGLSLTKVAPVSPRPSQQASSGKFVAQAPKDPEAFKAEIAAWRDKVWSGLSSTRFEADKIAWKGSDGQLSFSDKALTAYLAESLARGSYPDALARVRGAKEKWPDKPGFLSAPYLGGLVPKMRDFSTADQAEVKRLSQVVADKSPTLFEKEGLLRYLFDRLPNSLAQDALRYSSGVDPSKLTIRQAVGFLGCVVDARSLLKDEDNPFRGKGAVADRLAASVLKSSNGFFLVTEDDGSTDLRLSLLAGSYLVAYGNAASKPALVGIGQSLVEGAIGLSDAQGFAPARVLVHGALEQRTGTLAPEDLYPLVADNPYYPHVVSFSRDVTPGLWAWTCAPSLTVQTSASRYVFSARFLVGSAHFLTFYGVKPFVNIQLYEIDYSPDNDFESYNASGYLYNKAQGALFLKMKHKKENEDIKLSF
ncbi:MAG: hypothetical protein ABSF43_06770 [Rectinemataceae bacterium]|jgi:hypothetical protein